MGAGVEAGNFPTSDPRTNIDFSETNILVTYNSGATWGGGAFNGWHAFDMGGTMADITSVTINGATNMSGFDASRITFDANNIWVNWNALGFDTSTIVSLDVGFAEIPEPSALVLLGIGLAMVLLASRVRRRIRP